MTSDIEKVSQTALVEAKAHFADSLKQLSDILSNPSITTGTVSQLFSDLKDIQSNLDVIEKAVKRRIERYVLENGQKSSEAGSREVRVGRYILEARVMDSTIKAPKVETLLRAKGLKPEDHMDTIFSLALNEAKLQKLIDSGTLTKEEVESCRAVLKFAIQRPRLAKEE